MATKKQSIYYNKVSFEMLTVDRPSLLKIVFHHTIMISIMIYDLELQRSPETGGPRENL